MPGDLVELDQSGSRSTGSDVLEQPYGGARQFRSPAPHVPWGYAASRSAEVWLFGFNDPRSWDARYFGPVPLADVRGVLKPVLTW